MGKGKKQPVLETEVEILPFPILTYPWVLPKSPWTQAHQYSPEHIQTSASEGIHSCLSIPLTEMVSTSDSSDAFPQRQLEKFPAFTTFFQI